MESIAKFGDRKWSCSWKFIKIQTLWVNKKMTIIETTHPGYLHGLYRYATCAIGAKSSFWVLEIAMYMNNIFRGERRETISIVMRQLWVWLSENNGK